jgi:hypothetical protein
MINLKDFPHAETNGYPEDARTKNNYVRYAIAVSDWYEAFQKQLREILTKEQGIVTLNNDDSTKDVLIGIKEILGDE